MEFRRLTIFLDVPAIHSLINQYRESFSRLHFLTSILIKTNVFHIRVARTNLPKCRQRSATFHSFLRCLLLHFPFQKREVKGWGMFSVVLVLSCFRKIHIQSSYSFLGEFFALISDHAINGIFCRRLNKVRLFRSSMTCEKPIRR